MLIQQYNIEHDSFINDQQNQRYQLKNAFASQLPVFGIISGAGPAAGATLYQFVIQEFQRHGAWQDADFPLIHLINFPFVDMLTASIEENVISDQVETAMAFMANKLGCDYIATACNTLHLFVKDLWPDQFLSFGDLVKTCLLQQQQDCEAPLVFASRTSVEANLYGQWLQMDVDYFDADRSQLIIDAILLGKAPDLAFVEAQARIRPVILGCTEYSAALADSSAPFIDPLRLVAKQFYQLSRH